MKFTDTNSLNRNVSKTTHWVLEDKMFRQRRVMFWDVYDQFIKIRYKIYWGLSK